MISCCGGIQAFHCHNGALLCGSHRASLRKKNGSLSHSLSLPLSLPSPPLRGTSEGATGEPPRVEDGCKRTTLRELCANKVPLPILQRVEELGYLYPTDVQLEALPIVLAGNDCIIQAQTGSGKTLAYLLPIFSKISPRAAVQAIVVVPTRELGMQVVKAARKLASKRVDASMDGLTNKSSSLNVMALLDGGTLGRQKSWLKAEPPQLVVGTVDCLCRMIENNNLRVKSLKILVIDEVDSLFSSSKTMGLLRKLLTSFTTIETRQTLFASATIPQHNRFKRECITEKWTRENLVYVHTSPLQTMPPVLQHHYVICESDEKVAVLCELLKRDVPDAAIIFVNRQSKKIDSQGAYDKALSIAQFITNFFGEIYQGNAKEWEPVVLHEDRNINSRAQSIFEFFGGRRILIATDIGARGLDFPEVSHIYNFSLPPSPTDYVHQAGRTARKPLASQEEGGKPSIATTLISKNELFAFERYERELCFKSTPVQIAV